MAAIGATMKVRSSVDLKSTPTIQLKRQKITPAQFWLLIRRILVLIAANVYIYNSIQATTHARSLLIGVEDSSDMTDDYHANNILAFSVPDNVEEGGVSLVGHGKLVNEILKGNLTPRVNGTLYLHSPTEASFQECSNWSTIATQQMYNDEFVRKLYGEVVRDTASVVSEFVGTEMVVPIVDCSFTALQSGVISHMRSFYLMRKANSDKLNDAFLIAFSLSMEDYRLPELHQEGPTGLLVISIVSDFTSNNVLHYYALTPGSPFHPATYSIYTRTDTTADGYLVLESVPTSTTTADPSNIYMVSSRSGIYRKVESEQAHLKNIHWEPSPIPKIALSGWDWRETHVRCDAWAWVHGIHIIFAADTCFNLLILLLVIYRNKRKGKIWIGDAFVSISRSTITRAVLVILAWILNGYWTPHKFMLEEGNMLGNLPILSIYPHVMHADLMMIYLGIVDILGLILRERIDPALSMLLFEIGFANRLDLAKMFPSVVTSIVTLVHNDIALGVPYVHPKLISISPLRLTTTHELSRIPSSVSFTTLFPTFSTLLVIIAYISIRKVYRHYYPNKALINRGSSYLSRGSVTTHAVDTDAIKEWKSSLTIFEAATGAALQSRVGLVCDYDNCIYIKGMKFASADGVYCNGFVVANNKYLIRTSDLWNIFLMVVTRVRFRDIYVYDVDGYAVQKMARLFYPEMMTLADLLQLHSTLLS